MRKNMEDKKARSRRYLKTCSEAEGKRQKYGRN